MSRSRKRKSACNATVHDVTSPVNTNGHENQDTIESVGSQGERLDELQRAAGFLTLADFARAAGVAEGTARQQRNRGSIPIDAAAKYISAARQAGASVEWLLYGTGPKPRRMAAGVMQDTAFHLQEPIPTSKMSQEKAGAADIPVWASAEGGMDGAIILTPDPVDYIRRSERMALVRNPFAFNVIGGSMSPAIEHGDQVVINPALHPRPGNDCLFVQEREDGSMLAMVKRLLKVTVDNWNVRQFSPIEDLKLPRKIWAKAFVIDEIRRAR